MCETFSKIFQIIEAFFDVLRNSKQIQNSLPKQNGISKRSFGKNALLSWEGSELSVNCPGLVWIKSERNVGSGAGPLRAGLGAPMRHGRVTRHEAWSCGLKSCFEAGRKKKQVVIGPRGGQRGRGGGGTSAAADYQATNLFPKHKFWHETAF